MSHAYDSVRRRVERCGSEEEEEEIEKEEEEEEDMERRETSGIVCVASWTPRFVGVDGMA